MQAVLSEVESDLIQFAAELNLFKKYVDVGKRNERTKAALLELLMA